MRVALLLLVALGPTLALAQDAGMLHAVDQDGKYQFTPKRLVARPGETLLVMAIGKEAHNVRAIDGTDWVARVDPDRQATFAAPTQPGEYGFYCKFHAVASTSPQEGMAGVLVVEAPAPGTMPTPEAASPTARSVPGFAPAALVPAIAAVILLGRR